MKNIKEEWEEKIEQIMDDSRDYEGYLKDESVKEMVSTIRTLLAEQEKEIRVKQNLRIFEQISEEILKSKDLAEIDAFEKIQRMIFFYSPETK